MTPQIIGTKKSGGFRRCERYCRERSLAYQSRDPIATPLGAGELSRIAEAVGGFARMIDENGSAFEKRGLAYMEYDPAEELTAYPELLRLPIVRTDHGVSIDPDERQLDALFGRA